MPLLVSDIDCGGNRTAYAATAPQDSSDDSGQAAAATARALFSAASLRADGRVYYRLIRPDPCKKKEMKGHETIN